MSNIALMQILGSPVRIVAISLAAAIGVLLGSGLPVGAWLKGSPLSVAQSDNASTAGITAIALPNTLLSQTGPAVTSLPSEIDTGFARSMLIHHQQALQLANLMLRSTDSPLKGLADSIRIKQGYENGLMSGWLLAWGQSTVAADTMAWVKATRVPLSPDDVLFISRCTANPGQMPGLASAAQLSALDAAQGAEKDRLFMELMLRHHEAAVDMARFAFNHATVPFVRTFALSVIREQGQEIAWLQQQLSMLAGERTRSPT